MEHQRSIYSFRLFIFIFCSSIKRDSIWMQLIISAHTHTERMIDYISIYIFIISKNAIYKHIHICIGRQTIHALHIHSTKWINSLFVNVSFGAWDATGASCVNSFNANIWLVFQIISPFYIGLLLLFTVHKRISAPNWTCARRIRYYYYYPPHSEAWITEKSRHLLWCKW